MNGATQCFAPIEEAPAPSRESGGLAKSYSMRSRRWRTWFAAATATRMPIITMGMYFDVQKPCSP